MAPRRLAAIVGALALNSASGQIAKRYDNCTCTPTIADEAGSLWQFDLRGLYRPEGYTFPRSDLNWNISTNICGDTQYPCADGTPQYNSYGAAIQYINSVEQTGSCQVWDPPFGMVPCTLQCIPLALSGAMIVTPLVPSNLASGGVSITFHPSADSAADAYECQADPNRKGLIQKQRTMNITLACDLTSNDMTLVSWTSQAMEPTECEYVVTGTSPAACGLRYVPTPSPSPSSSSTATASVTSTSTATSSATATATSTATSSATATATSSATGTATGSATGTATLTASSTPSPTSVLIEGIYSPLDRDVGIGGLGAVTGIAFVIGMMMASHRRWLPWQWESMQRVAGSGGGGGGGGGFAVVDYADVRSSMRSGMNRMGIGGAAGGGGGYGTPGGALPSYNFRSTNQHAQYNGDNSGDATTERPVPVAAFDDDLRRLSVHVPAGTAGSSAPAGMSAIPRSMDGATTTVNALAVARAAAGAGNAAAPPVTYTAL